ncbi:unnamed protein product [Adineta steineri]|uniref:Uncharacterized protein n=1 Tax=Adineta steineri TaxID=433720 RepID=A0A815GZN4_9BILA|nr:unnamed protein product [Adineta steineri]CAF1594991.1 unnamed protein product [Adineta steineri]
MTLHNIRPVQCDELSTVPYLMSSELNYEDITLIWLDENENENFDCLDTKCRLNIIVNYFKVFNDAQETLDYIRSALNEHLFLIVSGSLGEIVTSQIYNESQLKFIYVFCINKEKHSEWTCKYEKICGIFIDKNELFHHLSATVRAYEKSLTTISIFNKTCTATEEKSARDYIIEENISLMWLQSFIDILLHLPIDKNIAKQDMIAECRLYYQNNAVQLKEIDEFENNYCSDTVIYWYTRDSFVYRIVNKALRTLNIDIIFKFRFLIIDLYQQLKQHHADYIRSLSTINPKKIIRRVYRSQRMGFNEIEKLQASVNNLICPNSFFSTTENYLMSTAFVAGGCGSECVLFRIDIPDSYYHTIQDTLQYTRPFSKIESLSQFKTESEVIFSMGALFRIESVEQDYMWYVCMKFEGENDELGKNFYITGEFENGEYNWQNRCNIEDRILLLTEKLPQSCRNILNIYIKYGVFADENHITTTETLTTYRKGFELIMKCLPNYHFLITVVMHLSIDHPFILKSSLNMLLKQILTEYRNQRMYGSCLKKLHRLIEQFLKIRPSCFAKTYCNAQMLRELRETMTDYRRLLYFIQRAYFSTSHNDTCKAQKNNASIESCSTDIGRVIHKFVYSSHVTLCPDKIQQKPRQRHRSSWTYRYQTCGCLKNASLLSYRSTGRWAKFCKI